MSVVLHLIRHGETTANATQTIAGWSDVPLTERGREQAARLSALLADARFDSVWSSDLDRAVTTARLAGYEPRPERRVRELDFGDLEGKPWGHVLELYAGHLTDFSAFSAPGGERVADMRTRIFEFVEELPAGNHAVFCHGGVIRVLLGELGEHRFVANCAVVEVDWTQRRFVSERVPDRG